MRNTIRHYILIIMLSLLAFTLNSSAIIDKNSPDYGRTHKQVFNVPDNCTLCHLYNNFASDLEPGGGNDPTSIEEDDYEYEDNSDVSDGGLGWFLGRRKPISSKEDISGYISNLFITDNFVDDKSIIPHEFNQSITKMCVNDQCHSDGELGPSHAVDVSPYKRFPNLEVPKELPLNWDTDKYEEVITCGSCHNPHIDWLSTTKSFKIQKPEKIERGQKYYKTYFVRIQDPDRGYYVLCRGCHGDEY